MGLRHRRAHLELEGRLEARATWDSHRAAATALLSCCATGKHRRPRASPGTRSPMRSPTPPQLGGSPPTSRGMAAAYSDLVLAAGGELLRFAALSLQEAAVRAARWSGGTEAFPGITER